MLYFPLDVNHRCTIATNDKIRLTCTSKSGFLTKSLSGVSHADKMRQQSPTYYLKEINLYNCYLK